MWLFSLYFCVGSCLSWIWKGQLFLNDKSLAPKKAMSLVDLNQM